MKFPLILALVCSLSLQTFSQSSKAKKEDWHLLDPAKDGYMGISLPQAYELLKGRKSQTVIVAVIDSGIDTLQNDLKDHFWHNPGEIPNNGIDDDGDGLVDDVIGWNYLGGKNNENLSISVPEAYRTYYRFKNEFADKTEKDIPAVRQYVYSQWKKAEKILNEKYEKAIKEIDVLKENYTFITATNGFMTRYLNKESFNRKDLVNTKKRDSLGMCMQVWKDIFKDNDFTNTEFIKDFETYKKKQEDAIEQKSTPPYPYRDSLLGDNSSDFSKIYYGNNNLQGFSGYHGTSVSGVIGAIRNNGTGIDGIADNVRIMMIRSALGEDEFDKDVAVAIRYAVDHGAKVINMSFGKPLSPDKKWVDEAVRYAQEKDVVLVHASGNDGKNIDEDFFYPNAYYLDGSRVPNFINVGASGDLSNGGIAASFSNYGKKMVDVFAPGVDVHCSIANNGTQESSGTSLASPVVAGIAALLRSYFPELTAPEIISIIKKSGTPVTEEVVLPGTEDQKVPFSTLSESGKIANAYNAVKMAIDGSYK